LVNCRGTLAEKNPPQVLVDCHGVGYEVDVPMSTFYNLPALGDKVTLLTHFVVREDAQILFGFATASEREAFRQLIKISGRGPAHGAQRAQRHERGRHCPGRDGARRGPPGQSARHRQENRRAPAAGTQGQIRRRPGRCRRASVASDAQADILQALVALGYSDKEAALALKALPKDVGVSEGIKLALKALAK
jgi:Holliday junction DNA helicase RuvA